MAKIGFRIFDANTHVGPYLDVLEKYLTNAVIDLIGEDVLMYASDYPHGESHFPHTVEMVMAWDMPESRKRKLFWDNAVRLYARCGLS